MTRGDEQELLRLTDLLERLDGEPGIESQSREALQKAALALSVCFLHGLRSEVEKLYAAAGKTLSPAERDDLIRHGLDPDAEVGS